MKNNKKEDKMNEAIDKALEAMQPYGWFGVNRQVLKVSESAMRFFVGVLRQQSLTEAEIEEIQKFATEDTN